MASACRALTDATERLQRLLDALAEGQPLYLYLPP